MRYQNLLQKPANFFKINWKKVANKSRILNDLLRQSPDYHLKKDNNHLLIELIVSFLNDFHYHLSFQDVQRIFGKAQPENSWEILIHKIGSLFNQTVNLSMDVVFNRYHAIVREIYALKKRQSGLMVADSTNTFTFLTVDTTFFDNISQLNPVGVDFHFLPLVNLQIVNLEVFNAAKSQQPNLNFSKVLTMLCLRSTQNVLPFFYYQKAIDLVTHEYQTVLLEVSRTHEYDKLINFVFDALNKFVFFDQSKRQILQALFNKKRIIFSKHQQHFLFIVIYFNLNHFDWAEFRRIANLTVTKQHIIRNLNFLTINYLLKSQILKKRKFYFQSKWLKDLLIKNRMINLG